MPSPTRETKPQCSACNCEHKPSRTPARGRRCDCGNRRVGWESWGDFENMNVYADAF